MARGIACSLSFNGGNTWQNFFQIEFTGPGKLLKMVTYKTNTQVLQKTNILHTLEMIFEPDSFIFI